MNPTERINNHDYIIQGLIGEGAAGVVFTAERDNQIYALKMIRKYYQSQIKEQTDREIQVQTQLSEHPNIVKLFEYEVK